MVKVYYTNDIEIISLEDNKVEITGFKLIKLYKLVDSEMRLIGEIESLLSIKSSEDISFWWDNNMGDMDYKLIEL